ncbi:retrovirus-related pol polyprotein from transposon TNT 1-94 [Tanacetum coccineum]
MKAENWTLLDRQALGAVRLSLEKNVAYNVVNEKTTYDLFKALSNMYEKPSASNKVFLIRQLVNTKMKEGASVADHVNEFNSILSRLMSVDIKFDDEVQALLLLSSLPESWSGTVTTVIGSTGSTKLKFDSICDLILREDIRRKKSGEYSNSLLSAEDKGRGRKQDRGQKQNKSRSKSKKRGQSKNRQDITDKEVNMAAGDYDDAFVCCVENTIDDRIMDFGALFHATYCKEELERFKLRFGKVRLADDKTLDIAGIRDVVLKTSFGTSWTLKDVRYILGLKKRLISVGKLDEEGYHVGFGDQQWKVTKGSLVIAHGNKRGSLYMVGVPSDGINTSIDGRGNVALWHQRLGHMSEKGMKILASKGRIPYLQKVVVGFCEPCVLGKQKRYVVPTGRVLSPGSDNESDDVSVHSEAIIAQQQQNIQPQIITTISNNNAMFPYLKKDEYEVWAIKMEYWITNNDINIWKVIQNGNSLKRTGRDHDVIILPPTTTDEHIAIQRESKARTT